MDFDLAQIQGFNDHHLIQSAGFFVKEERRILAILLHHFYEIDKRRLYSDHGCKSLHDLLVKHYKYSDDQAYRRRSAMRLMYELPQIEEKICSGELTLSSLNIAQTLFRSESYSQARKLEVIEKISGKSSREAERITLSISSQPEMLKPDRVIQVTPTTVEMKFTATNELQTKIEKLRGLLAHKKPNIALGELFEDLCDLALKEWSPTRASMKPRITRQVFAQAKHHKCEICKSTYALEVDHVIPKAKGGDDTPENRRLLCRSCNQRAAIKHFGQKKMNTYFR